MKKNDIEADRITNLALRSTNPLLCIRQIERRVRFAVCGRGEAADWVARGDAKGFRGMGGGRPSGMGPGGLEFFGIGWERAEGSGKGEGIYEMGEGAIFCAFFFI